MRIETDEEDRKVSPAKMLFLFEMGNSECHEKLTGTCSLERKRPDRIHDKGEESDFDYCPKLLRSLRKHGQFVRVRIIRWKCGHYGFHDGQHRVCIAKRRGLTLDAAISAPEPPEDCEICSGALRPHYELR